MLLSDRLQLVSEFPLFFRTVLGLTASEMFRLDLAKPPGLIFALLLSVSGVKTTADRSTELDMATVLALREARIVTCGAEVKENINVMKILHQIRDDVDEMNHTFVPAGRPSSTEGFLKVLWT